MFLYCFVYVYLLFFVLSVLVLRLLPPSENSIAVSSNNNDDDDDDSCVCQKVFIVFLFIKVMSGRLKGIVLSVSFLRFQYSLKFSFSSTLAGVHL